MRARKPEKTSDGRGVSFRGTYSTANPHDKVVVKICLEYKDNRNSNWLMLTSTCKKKSRSSAARVKARGRGPCFIGEDRYRTWAKGWSVNSRGERILERQDRSRGVWYFCVP